ncbi:MAG: DUF3866 family protein [Solirubrobacterales bacterium]
MLKLRRGTVTATDPLTVEVGGEERRAWADEGMVGEVREGDEVVLNTEALDLELGSGGFDVVHVNLTRGLEAPGASGAHVMKLNYTSLQHPVDPVEVPNGDGTEGASLRAIPVLVLFLHGQLAPAAWAAAQAAPGLRLGFVQTAGGALPGALSRDVAELRRRELLTEHVSAGPAHGGEREAIGVVGALHAGAESLGWDAIVAGPGPGILGSATLYGHGGMAALDTAHASLALGLETLVAPRLSAGDERERHRGLSHHTEAVLRLLLGGVRVPVPEVDDELWPTGEYGAGETPLDRLREACGGRHDVWVREVALDGYAASGLPTTTMGRELAEDRLFFAAALAAGDALAASARVGVRR